MITSSIKYYFKEYSISDIKPEVEITSTYNCGVTETSGINEYGEMKSIYTETYAENSDVKVYSAPKIARKTVDIVINIAFIGTNFQKDYDDFVSFISGKKLEYRDTLRNKRCFLLLTKEVKVETSNPSEYLQAEFTFLPFKESIEI